MVRASNSQHMEAHWLPAIQSGLHYLVHAGIIKESDQRADYFSTAELQDPFLFVLSLCRPLFLFVVFDSFLAASPFFLRSGTALTWTIWRHPSPEHQCSAGGQGCIRSTACFVFLR
ncbi:hypothetical protein AMECASPLE_011827 [Ameca splendens]|uniref:Uncharacterized protein n=1 Tax=Ameca splendens TaxID=208324 RepID=A0ABV1A878_9TELE